jgi:hypothetical protein
MQFFVRGKFCSVIVILILLVIGFSIMITITSTITMCLYTLHKKLRPPDVGILELRAIICITPVSPELTFEATVADGICSLGR